MLHKYPTAEPGYLQPWWFLLGHTLWYYICIDYFIDILKVDDLKKDLFSFFKYFICVFACVYVSVPCKYLVPEEARRGQLS